MTLTDFKNTVRENTPAIVTSIIVFLLVSAYLGLVVPANEAQLDNYNRSTLDEFNLQFNNTLKDFAGQVDIDNLRDSISRKADSLCNIYKNNGREPDASFLKSLQEHKDSILSDFKNNVILQSVSIYNITITGSEIILHKKIHFKFSDKIKNILCSSNPKTLNALCSISDTSHIEKAVLKKRLNGAIAFQNWIIYPAEKKEIILGDGIDKEEFDSIYANTAKYGMLHFNFSNRRFYRQSVSIEGTNNNFILIGAVNQDEFEAKAKKVNLNITFISVLFVVLLFLSIPLVKPLISNKKERLTQFDLLCATGAIGILAIVLISFTFSRYLSLSYEDIALKNLITLHANVNKELKDEFAGYYGAFTASEPVLNSAGATVHNTPDVLEGVNTMASMQLLNKPAFQNFFTFGSSGDLIRDISKDEVFSMRKNFSERDYFRVLRETPYRNLLTAVFSKYDNKYKFVYVQKNLLIKDSLHYGSIENPVSGRITDLAQPKTDTVGFSLSGFAYSPGFALKLKNNPYLTNNAYRGYILCNKTGRVLLSNDSSKSLNENIYLNSQKNYELSKMMHGVPDTSFELNYNGEDCLFYVKKITTDASTPKECASGSPLLIDYPLYLLTYKNLWFTNRLKIYTLVNGFLLSFAYTLGITFLILMYSVFFYLGEISVLSRYHVHWLFPDNSRRMEYLVLRCINYIVFVIFLCLFISGYEHTLYLSCLTGINLAFLNFVLLNQRVFILKKGNRAAVSKRNNYLFKLVMYIAIPGYLLPLLLYLNDLPSLGLSLSLISHLAFLYGLKNDTEKSGIPRGRKTCIKSNRPVFISFFSSVISYHYILVPAFIIFNLFISEVNMVKDLNNSALTAETGSQQENCDPVKHILSTDGKVIGAMPVEPPSKKYLENARFDTFSHHPHDFNLRDFIQTDVPRTILFIVCIWLIIMLIQRLINFYSGRFFFFELSEAYRLKYFKTKDPFTNYTIILPPYTDEDLSNLELEEKPFDDINESDRVKNKAGVDSKIWLRGVPSNIVSNQVKTELIMMRHFKIYGDRYQKIWALLSDSEQFVLNDFAVDSFVNYKNRNVLLNLMEKGYIIADPLTGRLRIMNYGFRNYIIHLWENDPDSASELKLNEEAGRGTYSKWKLPLIILAVSGILMFMYLNKESFNQMLFVGGSAVSAIGLLAKFLDMYKQR